MVKKIGPDRPVRPVGLGTDGSNGLEIKLIRLAKRTGKTRSNLVGPDDSVKPAHPRLDRDFRGSLKVLFFVA